MIRKRRVFPWPVFAALGILFVTIIVASAAALPTASGRTTDRSGVYNTGGFTFTPPKMLVGNDDLAFFDQAGEPEIKTDHWGNIYVTSMHGAPGGLDFWKSTDKGANFVYMGSPDGAQDKCGVAPLPPCELGAGGGDDSIDVSFGGHLYISSLWLGNTTMSVSTDGGTGGVLPGQKWEVNPASGGIPVEDRQWIAALGNETVYMTWRQAPGTGVLVFTKSTDGGKTFSVPTLPFGTTVTAAREGNLVVDKYNGNLYSAFVAAGNPAELRLMKSTNGGTTWTNTTIYTGPPGTSTGNAFPIMAVDRGGNLHLVFTRCTAGATRTNCHVYLTSSTDQGATWLEIVRVDSGPGNNATVEPWVNAGSPGVVNVTWYGSPLTSPDLPSVAAPSPVWHVFFAQTRNALDTSGVVFNQVQVTTNPVHDKPICSAGGACAAETRDFLEYYTMDIDPDGNANIVYMDGLNSDGATDCPESTCITQAWYAKQTTGPSAYAPPPAPAPVTFAPNLAVTGQTGTAEPNVWTDSHNCIFAGAIGGPRFSNSTDNGATFTTQNVVFGTGLHGGDFEIVTLPKPDGTRPDMIYTSDLGVSTVHVAKSVIRNASGTPTFFAPTGATETLPIADRMWMATDRFGGNQYVYMMDHDIVAEFIRFTAMTNDTATSASMGSGLWSPFANGSPDPDILLPPNTTEPNTNPGPVFVNPVNHMVHGVFGAAMVTTNAQDPPFGKEPAVWEAIGPPPNPPVAGVPPGPFVNYPVFKGVIDSPAPAPPTNFPPEAARTHGSHVAAIFPSAAADKAGNIYVVWSTPSSRANTTSGGAPSTTFDIWFASSHDPDGAGPRLAGEEFYGPWKVSSGAGTSVFPWIDAGDDGKVDIVWYQSENVGPPLIANPQSAGTLTGGPNQMPAGSTWHVMFAQSLNANSREPVFRVVQASDHVMHNGSISIGGLTGSSDRSLLDFFEVKIGPDGKANIAYADNGGAPLHITYARQNGGPLAATPAPGLGCLAPTAVDVATLRATRASGSSGVRVSWNTAVELKALGFNVWRSTGKLPYRNLNVPFRKLNAKLIPSKSSFGVGGHRYEYLDRGARPGRPYLYRLELLLTDGTRQWVGPVRAAARARSGVR